MAHGLTNEDRAIYSGNQAAWHGLGMVVPDAGGPHEAREAVFPWEPTEIPLQANGGPGKTFKINSHKLIARNDTLAPLGVVGSGYTPLKNCEIADFAEALSEEGDVKVESAGSLWGGKRVWMLLRAGTIHANDVDPLHTYVCVADGKDGSLIFHSFLTSIRVVCHNTVNASIADAKRKGVCIALKHTAGMRERMEEARQFLTRVNAGQESMGETIRTLASRDVSREELQTFFTEVYEKFFDKIPANPSDKSEKRKRDKAAGTIANWTQRFDAEAELVGASLWSATQAITAWIEHQGHRQSKDEGLRHARRVDGSLFGSIGDKSAKIYRYALERV